MIVRAALITFLVVFCFRAAYAAGEAGVEQEAKRGLVYLLPESEKDRLYCSSYYEYGWVKQGARSGDWKLLSTTVGYTGPEFLSPYVQVDLWDRLGTGDYTINTGAYIKFSRTSYLHSEIGYGGVHYLYRFLGRLEYEHSLIRALSWQAGARYLHYPENDVYIMYPGLIYYFGDDFVSLFYNHSLTESRGAAHAGIMRGSFSLNRHVSLYAGAAVGERLYDIFPLVASEQFGYIGFVGFNCKFTRRLAGRLGFSYSTEHPDFIKRSVEFGLSAKF